MSELVYGARLKIECTGNCTVGSNPSASANMETYEPTSVGSVGY